MALPSCTQLHIAMVYTHWISPRWNYNNFYSWYLMWPPQWLQPYRCLQTHSTVLLRYIPWVYTSVKTSLSQWIFPTWKFYIWHSWYISKVVICDPRNDFNYMHADVSSQRKVFWQPLNIVCQIGSTAMYSSSNAWSVWTADVWRADLLRHDAWQIIK